MTPLLHVIRWSTSSYSDLDQSRSKKRKAGTDPKFDRKKILVNRLLSHQVYSSSEQVKAKLLSLQASAENVLDCLCI
jgi:hypothetical protein